MNIDILIMVLAILNLSVITVAGYANPFHPWARRVRDICGAFGLILMVVAVSRLIA